MQQSSLRETSTFSMTFSGDDSPKSCVPTWGSTCSKIHQRHSTQVQNVEPTSAKVSGSNLITRLNQTPTIEWHVVRCVSKTDTK